MRISPLLLYLSLLLPAAVQAATVVYTDTQHLPSNITDGTQVVWLDGPEQVQLQLFGQLPADPQAAAAQAKAILGSPTWHEQEQELAQAWQAIIHARDIGVEKYPAVVFDDREVVYGTADVVQAMALRAQGGAQ